MFIFPISRHVNRKKEVQPLLAGEEIAPVVLELPDQNLLRNFSGAIGAQIQSLTAVLHPVFVLDQNHLSLPGNGLIDQVIADELVLFRPLPLRLGQAAPGQGEN